MNLLVMGDSFAQFSGYRGYIEKTANDSREFDHWCELVAKANNGTVATCGISGASIGLSTMVGMHRLLNDTTVTHVINFISYHLRTTIGSLGQRPEDHTPNNWQELVEVQFEDPANNSQEVIDNFYKDHNLEIAPGHSHMEHNKYLYVRTNAQELCSNMTGVEEFDARRGWIHNQLVTRPAFEYVHSTIGNILTVDAYCKSNNIKIVHVVEFTPTVAYTIPKTLNCHIDLFDVIDIEKKYSFSARDDFPSHYNNEEHRLIFNEFKSQFKHEWFNN